MALSTNASRTYDLEMNQMYGDLPVKATSQIYVGSALCDNGSTGAITALANAGTDNFVGFADEQVLGLASDGLNTVRTRQRGVVTLAVTGVTGITDLDSPVYATDDNTFTLTSTSATTIGKVIQWISGTSCKVAFEGLAVRSL